MKENGCVTKSKYPILLGILVIDHSENCLPELEIKYGFSKFWGFFKKMALKSRYYTFKFSFTSTKKGRIQEQAI